MEAASNELEARISLISLSMLSFWHTSEGDDTTQVVSQIVQHSFSRADVNLYQQFISNKSLFLFF